jgi:hypothetical protein
MRVTTVAVAVVASVFTLAIVSCITPTEAVPVYVMMPLDLVNAQMQLNDPSKIQSQLNTLSQQAHIDGYVNF